MLRQIRFSGFGGQGIIRSGYIGGKAAALFDEKFATMTQSFGPEARGSACSSQLVISDTPVLYPYVDQADVLVAMSQEAYEKYTPRLRKGGSVLIDQDLVSARPVEGISISSVPATRIAEELGNSIVANVVMLGFFAAVNDAVSVDAFRKVLPSSVPKQAVEINLQAFERGYQYGLQSTQTSDDVKKPKKEPSRKRASTAKHAPAT